MSDDPTLGFGKFVPGFDFLQNIAKGAGQAMPNLSNWVAPTLSVEELDKRIGELKAVHFWLGQNSKALGATIQALEVQKMTLATLKGMNFSMAEVASALTLKADEAKPEKKGDGAAATQAAGVVDPLQWWGALTQQFQQIAAGALKDAARNTALDTARNMAAGMARDAVRSATEAVQAATGVGAARKSAAGKSTAAKPATKKSTRKAPARKRSAATSK